jgi:hypothetical protein
MWDCKLPGSWLAEILVWIHFPQGLEDSLAKFAALAASELEGSFDGVDVLDGKHDVEHATELDRSQGIETQVPADAEDKRAKQVLLGRERGG